MVKIILDAMGGDNAPQSTIEGAVSALSQDKDLYIILAGRKDAIESELSKYKYDAERVEILDCPDAIGMNDIPTEAIKNRKASLVAAYWELKKRDDIAGLVTAGSTGATIVGGQIILGRIRGVKRPALCPPIPNSRGSYTMLCDCGANAECKPAMLCQFAVLASAYAKVGFGIENPRVGLINNGTEEHKGDPLHQQTYAYMTKMPSINFVGNREGRDIMIGDIDVAVTDGFSGNIALKSIEGSAKMVLNIMKTQFKSSPASLIGSVFLLGAIKRMKKSMDFDAIGGALLLGVKKVVIKSHGSSKATSICQSLLTAAKTHRAGLVKAIEEQLAEVDWDNLILQE